MKTLKEFRRCLQKKRTGYTTREILWDLLFFLLAPSRHHHYHHSRDPLEKDISDILSFDQLVRRGETVMVPQMRTAEGARLWRQYIVLYRAERAPVQTEQLGRGSKTVWHCNCGRTNLSYVSTCVCGRNERDIPAEKRDLPRSGNRWYCTCGRIHTDDVMVCTCGREQSDGSWVP